MKRAGDTEVTSVSVSKHFSKLIDQYNISPTEAFRRGIAVTLFDLGITDYQSSKNKERFDFVEKYMKELEAEEEKLKLFEQINDFEKILKILPSLKECLRIFDEDTSIANNEHELYDSFKGEKVEEFT